MQAVLSLRFRIPDPAPTQLPDPYPLRRYEQFDNEVAAILDQSPDLYEKTGIDAPVPKPSGSATEPPDSLPLAKVRVVAREVSDSDPTVIPRRHDMIRSVVTTN